MNKIDFVYIFGVVNSNPNGDPAANNEPRTNPITGKGIVRNGCISRKIKNYIEASQDEKGMDIYYKKDSILEETNNEILKESDKKQKDSKQNKKKFCDEEKKLFMDRFFDIRSTGGVITKSGKSGGDIYGPVQFSMAESIDPVYIVTMTITRSCSAKKSEEGEGKDDGKETGKMGSQSVVCFGYYKMNGNICPQRANKTGMTNSDVDLLFNALENMWEIDKSSNRPSIYPKAIVVFEHNSKLGNVKSHELYRCVKVIKNKGVEEPSCDDDYKIEINDPQINGITMKVLYLDA